MRIKLITLITVLTICVTACGQKQSKTDKENMESVKENIEEAITKDILLLPEMQFPHAAVMIAETPTADQPYYIVQGGSNMDDHFATSFWFHVYTTPEYEIRIYDVVSDSEMTLEEWRNSNPTYDEVYQQGHDGGAEENVAAYVTRDGERFRIDKDGKERPIDN